MGIKMLGRAFKQFTDSDKVYQGPNEVVWQYEVVAKSLSLLERLVMG